MLISCVLDLLMPKRKGRDCGKDDEGIGRDWETIRVVVYHIPSIHPTPSIEE